MQLALLSFCFECLSPARLQVAAGRVTRTAAQMRMPRAPQHDSRHLAVKGRVSCSELVPLQEHTAAKTPMIRQHSTVLMPTSAVTAAVVV